MKSHIYARRVKIRGGSLPWMNSSIRKELNKRYKLLLKAQQTPKGSQAWKDYKKARNHCTKLLRSAESNYWLSKFNARQPVLKIFGRQKDLLRESEQLRISVQLKIVQE